MNKRFWLGLVGYVVPSFVLGFVWHLVLFASQYEVLQVYRRDIIIPFGLLSMFIQGAILSWLFPKVMHDDVSNSWFLQGLKFGLVTGLFAWSYSTIAVSAKHVMTSVPMYLALETGFTALHYAIVGPLIALAHRYSAAERPALASA